MKKSLIILAFAALVACGSAFGIAYGASSAGTEQDPLVTKSYVESLVTELKESLAEVKTQQQELSEKIAKVEETEAEEKAEEETKEKEQESQQSEKKEGYTYCEEFTVVNFSAGDTVILGAGSEFILRKANSIQVHDTTTNGIPDLTSGTTLKSGANIPRDHLFVIPRDDGRGFTCTVSTIVMVKGCYIVE